MNNKSYFLTELGERSYCSSPESTLKGTTIYFSQEGVDSVIVYKSSQPQAKPQSQHIEHIGQELHPTSPMVYQRPRSNLKESIRHSGLRSPTYSHHYLTYMNLIDKRILVRDSYRSWPSPIWSHHTRCLHSHISIWMIQDRITVQYGMDRSYRLTINKVPNFICYLWTL